MTRRKTPAPWLLGALTPGKEARNYVLPPQGFPTPTVHRNSLMANMTPEEARRLVAEAPHRPGSRDAFALPSKGGGC